MNAAGSESTMSETQEQSGTPVGSVLICHVYRDGNRCAFLVAVGDHDALEIDECCGFGGDWEEALVLYEDVPPNPPRKNGLWEMRWPWRPANHRPADHALTCPDIAVFGDCDCEFDADEICCTYIGQPTWTLLVPAPASAQ